jgi:hypothetical protein
MSRGFATPWQPARRPAAQAALALRERHTRERSGDAADQQVDDAAVEEAEQEVELSPIGWARQRRDLPGDALAQVRRPVGHERRCDSVLDVSRRGRERQRV